MCRIAAIVSNETDSLIDRISRMTQVMHRGGPDNDGQVVNQSLGFALGHRRLSILDLTEAGNQPMQYADGRFWITFNGEIYNFKELKTELIALGHSFSTHTDTEVLLAGYETWGVGMLCKLKGMFAFIIADTVKENLFIARDHMGIKPLYMGKHAGDFYFSSEVKAFTEIDDNWEPNLDWRIWFLTFGFLPEPITTLKNVWPITPGYYVLFDLKDYSYKQERWYTEIKSDKYNGQSAVEQTKQLFEQAIQRHLLADVKVGVFLSGGIDSSIIAILAAKNTKEQIATVSIDFEDADYSERPYQDIIAKQINSDHYRFLVTQKDFVDAWDDIYQSLDQPTIDAINSYFICKYAKGIGLKVVLSGIGADEIFGGYPSFNRTRQFKQLQRLSVITKWIPAQLFGYPLRKLNFLKKKIEANEYLLYRGLFTPSDVAKILHISEKKVWATISTYKLQDSITATTGDKSRISKYESEVYMLNQLLKDADIQSMWHSIELRVPFLDIDLVQFVRLLPDNIKYPEGSHKFLLVQAFKDMLPKEIYDRKKQGFTFPFDEWLPGIPAMQNPRYVPTTYFDLFQKKKLNYSRLWAVYLAASYSDPGNLAISHKFMQPDTLFMYLAAFGKAGGIEKVNKVIMHCLDTGENCTANAYGLHDDVVDSRYFPQYAFKGYSGKVISFLLTCTRQSRSYKEVIIGHLNLAPAAWLMRMVNPSLKLVVVVHGIEAWPQQKRFSKWLLSKAHRIISVSGYTKQQLVYNSKIDPHKIQVLHNCLDPFFKTVERKIRKKYLVKRYGLASHHKLLLTITRMSKYEQYKGYDQVLQAIAQMPQEERKDIIYILAGKGDDQEMTRIRAMIKQHGLELQVILPGYIPEDELQDHYQLADVFIMPSKKEGFGIVLIEAAASGLQVIAGNCDGSVEAMQYGALGTLIDPDDITVIQNAISQQFLNSSSQTRIAGMLQAKTYDIYNFEKYKETFAQLTAK